MSNVLILPINMAGTWSKNWQLREKGECINCPPGINCPLDGMTNPVRF